MRRAAAQFLSGACRAVECAAEAHSRHLHALVESLASEERGLFSPLCSGGGEKRPVARRLHTDAQPAAPREPPPPGAQVTHHTCSSFSAALSAKELFRRWCGADNRRQASAILAPMPVSRLSER